MKRRKLNKLLICLIMFLSINNCFSEISSQQSGNKKHISLQFNEAPVRDMLLLMAQHKGLNLIVGDAVSGNISIHLNQVSWEEALDVVLVMKNLEVRKIGRILYIGSTEEIEAQRQQENHIASLGKKAFYLHYVNAKDVSEMLQSSGDFLSERGSIAIDEKSNMLWVKDFSGKLNELSQFIYEIDRPVKQIRIKAKIVNVDHSSVKELGLKFGVGSKSAARKDAGQLHMDLPMAIDGDGHFSFAIAKLANDTLLNLELSALEQEGRAKMISKPQLTTSNRTEALIESGQEIPYQESASSGATSTTFKKAVLSLKVTPTITPDNKILLSLVVNQDKVSGLMVNGVPAVSTREVQTQVLIDNGETIVLGGIYEESVGEAHERIPFLNALPLVGHLFKHKNTIVEERELLIFVKSEVIS